MPASSNSQRYPRLLLVADATVAHENRVDLVKQVARALAELPPGSAMVQLRAKNFPTAFLVEAGNKLLAVTRQQDCPLIINSDVGAAQKLGADGVHLPEANLSEAQVGSLQKAGFIVGTSTHSVQAVKRAVRAGVDYLVCGPVWSTPSKPGWKPLGPEGLRHVVSELAEKTALYAIGGIEESNVYDAIGAGAHGVAAIRNWLLASDPGLAAAALLAACDSRRW